MKNSSEIPFIKFDELPEIVKVKIKEMLNYRPDDRFTSHINHGPNSIGGPIFYAKIRYAYNSNKESTRLNPLYPNPEYPGFMKDKNIFRFEMLGYESLFHIEITSGTDYEGSWEETSIYIRNNKLMGVIQDSARFAPKISISAVESAILLNGL